MKSKTKIVEPKNIIEESSNWPVYIFLFLFGFLLYANTIPNEYALDDVAVIQQNKFTKQGIAGIPEMLTTFYWQGFWDLNAGLYRPLSLITFALDYQFFGENPHVSHFVNVVLYAFTLVLLFVFLNKFFKGNKFLLSLFTTVLFAAHPIHTEVIANIKSRDELLCFLFFLLSAIQFFVYLDNLKTKQLVYSLIFYFLALFSKEGAIVFLGIFPLLMYYYSSTNAKQILVKVLPYAFIALVFIAIHEVVIKSAATPKITYSFLDNGLVAAPNYISRMATAIYMMGKYLLLLIFPHPLSYDYSFNEIPATSFSNLKVLVTVVLYGFFIFYALKNMQRKGIVAFAILFFLITISLTSNIFMLIGATMGERFLYVPSLSFCLLIAMGIISAFKLKETQSLSDVLKLNKAALALIVLLLVGYSSKTISRNFDWKDNYTLFTKDVFATPGSSRTQYNYGTVLLNTKAANEQDTLKKNLILDAAIKALLRSTKIDSLSPGAFLNLASAYYTRKKYADAANAAIMCLQRDANEVKANSILGNAQYRLGNFDEAIKNLNICIDKKFVSDETYNFLGGSYFSKQDFPNAIVAFKKGLEYNSKNTGVILNLGAAYGMIRDFDNAIATFKLGIKIDPKNKQFYTYTALTYQNMGMLDSAVVYQNKTVLR
ncbi:MAG: DUF1736 domain-containing protein [Bacteroidetes bacterium]|nr:DUF1736 domain-containing protein [Bacteroidota bacterium]